ncbi:MAG TPA: AMP-binding protein [Acidimicrobiales bacterium]|nr:AMP-binding protein [Acidimicrobiales bacterium]
MTGSPLLDHLTRWAAETPDAPLFTFPPDRGRDPISYRRAAELVIRIAASLRARGVAPGDRVVVQVPSSPESVLLCLATQWAGGVFVPLNPALGPAETELLIADADPTVSVIGTDAIADLVGTGRGHAGGEPLHDLSQPVPRDPDDPAAIIYTSGTTGRPKGAIVTHGNLASNAETLAVNWGFRTDDVTVHALPTFHAHGLFVAVNTALVAGSTLHFLGRFDVDRVIDALAGPGTVFMGVPTFYGRLLASERFTREVAGGVRLFISGSAPLTEKTFAEFEARTGQRILERYGMSETEMIASNPLLGERKAGSVGFPLDGVQLRIRRGDDPAQHLAGAEEPGGIEVRGPNVFTGYWRMPERRANDFTDDGWFRTGDLGTLDPDGRLRLVGRSKDLIISGGENVYPAEIESVLDQLPGVAESAVVGMPDDDFGELGLAVIVADPDGPEPDTTALLAALRDRLAHHKVPRLCVVIDALPRNAMGKVQKALLGERFIDVWAHHGQTITD